MKTPADIRRLEELFHQAVKLVGEERAFFLTRLRTSDPELGSEIESLLNAHSRDGNLIDSPAYEAAAKVLEDAETQFHGKRSLGRYENLSLLGKGGMGEVYLAEDPELGRKVALKLLPARVTNDSDRLRRFTQEARAASALNHPNIITIHEVGQSDGTHFIATEFIEGDTLRKRLLRGRIALGEVLDIAIQMAAAIDAAHQAGIIHRDIKPENVMLRRDGYIKVLDFGLAKLTERSASTKEPADSQLGTAIITGTEPGVILGTVNYMSPEQARGRDVDGRSDIFSLGVVIYEMATGRAAFSGETSIDVVVSILEKEPPQLSRLVPEAPAELERIVSKALRKEREQRYQTTRDLLLDLKSLREEVAFKERLGSRGQDPIRSVTQAAASAVTKEQEARITAVPAKRRLAPGVSIIVLVLALSVAAALLWTRQQPAPVPTSAPPAEAAASPERFLRYWIMVQKYRGGNPFQEPKRLKDDINFEKDYRIRLNISSSQSGYLYLLNEGPGLRGEAPSFIVMFPSATTNDLSAQLNENQQIQIPERSWFQFDEQEGTEKIWLVWADHRVDELEEVKRFANPREKGLVADPKLKARLDEFLKSHGSQAPSVERDEDKTETNLRASGQMLVHVIKLSHH